MQDADYFAFPALNASLAKALIKSAAHGRHMMLAPRAPSPAQVLGTATHATILEPHRQDVFVVKRQNWTTIAGKQEREALQATGLPIITEAEEAAVYRMRDAVHANPELRSIIAKGKTEVPAFWDQRNVNCKAKADLVHDDCIFDLKTTQDASPAGFWQTIRKYGYHIQARHYLDGFMARDFLFIAVESTAPYAVGLYTIGKPKLDEAERLLDLAAARYRRGLDTGEWPSYASFPVELGGSFEPSEAAPSQPEETEGTL